MGRVVAGLADLAIVTSDNPRSEDPAAIAARSWTIWSSRSSSTGAARSSARWKPRDDGDVVVIAGKGHEQGQEVAGRKLPFDDREVVREALRRLRAPA